MALPNITSKVSVGKKRKFGAIMESVSDHYYGFLPMAFYHEKDSFLLC